MESKRQPRPNGVRINEGAYVSTTLLEKLGRLHQRMRTTETVTTEEVEEVLYWLIDALIEHEYSVVSGSCAVRGDDE